jgi:hypothetical protein
MTWCYVLSLKIPSDAKSGKYEGAVTFKPEKGDPQKVPLRVEAQPIGLVNNLPASFGLYHSGWKYPDGFDQQKLWREMLSHHRELGMTSTGAEYHFSVKAINGDKAVVEFDDRLYDAVKAAGVGRNSEQRMWGDIMRGGRRIAQLLGMQPGVDQNPGLELRHEKTALYKSIYKDMVSQIHEHFIARNVLIVLQPADEPRAIPNPWNRTIADTITYLKLTAKSAPTLSSRRTLSATPAKGLMPRRFWNTSTSSPSTARCMPPNCSTAP